MHTLFYVLAAMALAEGSYSLISGYRFHRYVSQEVKRPLTDYNPRIALLIPCKGLDPGFEENIETLLKQNYGNYYVIFITSPGDESLQVLERLTVQYHSLKIKLIKSDKAKLCGQKVWNLTRAVAELDADTEVLAFADSDVRVHSSWLHHLIDPLQDPQLGATTGYRWYLPITPGFWSVLQSVWNAGIVTLLGGHKRNFAWGGSMAITRKVFDETNVLKYWNGALSDDFALTRALNRAGFHIKFVPSTLVVSHEDTDFKSLLEWTTRQMIITRVYSPGLWKLASLFQGIYNVTLFLGIGISVSGFLAGNGSRLVSMILFTILAIGVIKAAVRLHAVSKVLTGHRESLRRYFWASCLLPPVASMLTLYNIVVSATTNRIRWRGIKYELKSPNETLVLS